MKAKKSLGQHFLRSHTVIQKIILASGITPGDVVIEVGPGEGVLTLPLLESGARVIAVEKDPRCIALLTEKFSDALRDEHLILLHGDILAPHTRADVFEGLLSGVPSYKVVANIPYYITGALFRLFLEQSRQPTLITFLVQKEVGEQIVARNGKEGVLSLSIKVFGDPVYIGTVKRESFTPKPKVDSAIITIRNISHDRLTGTTVEHFFRLVKAGFRARRKMLAGNLVQGLHVSKTSVLEAFSKLGISEKVRGEDLQIETWLALANHLQKSITTHRGVKRI